MTTSDFFLSGLPRQSQGQRDSRDQRANGRYELRQKQKVSRFFHQFFATEASS